MAIKQYMRQLYEGLWPNNIVLKQTLALCPTLAVTSSATNGLGMGLATLVVIMLSNVSISCIRSWVTPQVRLPVFTLIIAALVTLVDQAMNAWVHDLHKILGLFIPLIVTNCAIFGRAESFASKNAPVPSLVDGLATGIGFTFALVLLGASREIVGQGTLFSHASLLLGPHFTWLEVTLLPNYHGFLPAILPSGGFFFLGLLIVGYRLVEQVRVKRKLSASAMSMESTS
ncbi:electron transport complex subunit E [Celerinatantimonas yamalensis]|uniref:Ion-translocating oxidoreductase complex subunit E n=1 Tax=Celerinatantimonas yamalensis TaxID=559956 RepID=A0ABW9G4I5_9GAMM